jgi:conjugal transfer mating pair stabilization protein TraG
LNAGAKAGIGGKVLGAEVGASAGGTWDHRWTKTTGDQEAHGTSDSLSQSQGSNVTRYHANGQDITLTDGGYWRDGTFHRIENFSEKRHAIERDFSEAQSLERQATRSDEVGSRLERMASLAQQRLPDLRRHEPGHCLALCRNGRKPRVPRSGRAIAPTPRHPPISAKSAT